MVYVWVVVFWCQLDLIFMTFCGEKPKAALAAKEVFFC
jgi:hypothetical protein